MSLSRILLIVFCGMLSACGASRPEGRTCDHVRSHGRRPIPVPRTSIPAPAERPEFTGGNYADMRVSQDNAAFVENLLVSIKTIRRAAGPRRVLAISAGGQWGAYGAGVISGLAQKNPAEIFDIITGVSTGALLAPLVFVGDYHNAKIAYTTISDADIYSKRNIFEVIAGNSLVDTIPLRQYVEKIVTDDFVARIAAEGSNDRILAVQTVDLDSGDSVTFDLTAIAQRKYTPCGDNVSPRDCIIAGMLAAAAIPVGFPPVFINGEMFVDGGLRNYAFTIELIKSVLANPEAAKRANKAADFLLPRQSGRADGGATIDLTLIADTDFESPMVCTNNSTLAIAARTATIAVDQLSIGSFFRLLTETQSRPASARYTYADPSQTGCMQEQASDSGGIEAFNTPYMQCLYQRGCEMASLGESIWHYQPNDLPHSPTVRLPTAARAVTAKPGVPDICKVF